MPRPNEHVCDIRPTEGYDRVRNEPEDSDNPMEVDGKRVYRTYGFKDDTSEIVMYRFPRDETWADATQTARSWCEEHDGSFEPMTGESEAGIYYRGDGSAQSLTAAQVMEDMTEQQDVVWHPLIPLGTFDHSTFGEFETTREDAEEMVANFTEGLPTSKGIPIDEDPTHTGRTNGAYGWITEMEVRDGAVWAAIQWTGEGRDAVEDGRLPFISAHWYGSDSESPSYGRSNLVIAAALCTRPFFHDQPELRVATVDYKPTEHEDKQKASSDTTTGDDSMAAEELYEKARTAYEAAKGDVTDEEFDEIIEGVETEDQVDAFIAALEEEDSDDTDADTDADDDEGAPEDELASLRERNAELEAQLEQARGAKEELTEQVDRLSRDVKELQSDKQRTELESELAATTLEGNRRYTDEVVSLMASAQLEPSAENVEALQSHIQENDGAVATVPMGESPAITATNDEGELTGDAWLESKNITDETKQATRTLARKHDVPMKDAYGMHLDNTRP